MNLSRLSILIISVVAQNQRCMDKCGAETDRCHSLCDDYPEYTEDARECHDECYYKMCRCFSYCGCPECCDNSDVISSKNENFIESDKRRVSQFLGKQTNFDF